MRLDATVTSAANPRIKAMRNLYIKKYRSAEQAFLVEGVRAIADGCRGGHALRTLAFDVNARANDECLNQLLMDAASAGGVELIPTTALVLGQICGRDNPHHAIAVFHQRWQPLDDVAPLRCDVWIALDSPRDPGNLGTIIRTCDAAGGRGVILLNDSCDPFSPETLRATTGALFDVMLVKSTTEPFIAWAKAHGVSLIGTTLAHATDYRDVCYENSACALVMGTEQAGLSAALLAACDQRVKIPMRGRTNSLNLAVASGLMLYEATNRRHHTLD